MKKIDSLHLVCSAHHAQQLISLGILPVASMCFESVAGQWEYAGEYFDQSPVLPAWTLAELSVLIGGEFAKPDLYSEQDWTFTANMMQWILYLPKKRREFINPADAAAAMLEHLLIEKEVKPEDCNARLEAFATKERFNPISVALEEEAKKK